MAKLVRENGDQSVADIILLAEVHSTRENFTDLYRVFGTFSCEIQELGNNSLAIEYKHYDVLFTFVGDFKVYYALFGI